jgi:hypothetical protein
MALMSVEVYRYLQAYERLAAARGALMSAVDALTERGASSTPAQLAESADRFARARSELHEATGILENDPLFRLAGLLPGVGSQARAALALAHIGADAALVGEEATAAFSVISAPENQPLAVRVPALLEDVGPHAAKIEAALERIQARRRAMPDGQLLGPLTAALAELDEHLPRAESLMEDYRWARRALPVLLGHQGRQRYLVLGMDNTEALPAGGFVLLYGLVEVEGGRVLGSSFAPSESIYFPWKEAGGYEEPPRPLRDYLLRGWPMGLGEVGWWPDFPTAAQHALRLYRQESGDDRPIDGVVGVNFQTLEHVLSLLGPVRIEEYGVTVDAANVVSTVLVLTHATQLRPWESHRYDFAAYLARAVIERLAHFETSRWGALLRTVQLLREEKAFLVYSARPDTQEALRHLRISGEVREEGGDYLMVADASVRSTKLNLVVRASIDLTVGLDEEGNARHTLRLSYANEFPKWATGQDPRLARLVVADGTLLMYGSYLRLLVPPHTGEVEVWSDQGPLALEDRWHEHGKDHLGVYLLLPVGAARELTFSYVVPSPVERGREADTYRLIVQRQPGAGPVPLRLRVELPPSARPVRATLDGEPLPATAIVVETDLSRDRSLSVEYVTPGAGR